MATKITEIIWATEKEVKQKKFNIFVAISLGNKWFNKKNLREYILWSLKYSKNKKIPIIIGDGLHAINYEVRDGYNPKRSMNRAKKEGDKVEIIVKEMIFTLPKDKQLRTEILRWDDAVKTPNYEEMRNLFYEEFNKNLEFKNFILKIVRKNIEKSNKIYNEQQIEKLAQYVLNELPLFLRGMEWKGIIYNLHPYPEFTMINELAKGMKSKRLFPKLYSKLDRYEAVIVELKVI